MFIRKFRIPLTALMLLLASTAFARGWTNADVPFFSTNPNDTGWKQNNIVHSNSSQAMRQLPAGVRTMLQTEVQDNPWITGHEEMQQKLGLFRPEAQEVFQLPYIPIPASKMKHSYMEGMSDTMKQNVTFTKNGQTMIRFFFHPLFADKYKELINHYGAVYGEYWATPTSSPRSLVVWRDGQPNKPIWVKVSVHKEIDHYVVKNPDGSERKVGISRVQSEKKAKRSALVNEAFRSISSTELSHHGLSYMAEPASFVPGKIPGRSASFDIATIFREIPAELTRTSSTTKWVPAFAFIKHLKETSRRTGVDPLTLAKNGLIEPLIRSYLFLGTAHGLNGEQHTQNFLLEVDSQGKPTGKIMLKDLDGYRMDIDMRIRMGRDIGFLEAYKDPFGWAKHSATQGQSSPAVLHGWYNKLIRNVNGFTTTRSLNGQTVTVYATPSGQLMERFQLDFPVIFARLRTEAIAQDPSLRTNAKKANERAVEFLFDAIAREQFKKITGIEIPKEVWGYGKDLGLNWGLNRLREQLFAHQTGLDGQAAQSALGQMFRTMRSRSDKRVWGVLAGEKFRLLDGGRVIEAISRSGKHAAYALLTSSDTNQLQNQLRAQSIPRSTRVTSTLATYAGANQFRRVSYTATRTPHLRTNTTQRRTNQR